jgi:signal transduction histidine kinase/CheY-like chemotaxis protein
MKRGEAGTAETELRFAAELSAAQLSAQASPELESKFVRSAPLDELQAKMLQNEKMAALGRMVSGIAHELNNPLTAIMGYAQLLLSHGLRQDQLVEARRVFEEAERASRIVKNLLYFAREEKPERTRVDVNEIVERALALRSYELRVQNVAVERELAPDLPRVMADAHQLQQAILNLVVNAEQALVLSRGKGTISIRTRATSTARIVLEVADDGPGVPDEIASRIFEPFFTTKPPGIGTGLGLSIVYGIVQQHEGEVTVVNGANGGAKFVIELPVVAGSAVEARGSASRGAVWMLRVPPRRILVVEDEPTIAQLVVDVLEQEGHQVDAVLDSQEGLTRISIADYDLVICDLRMPRMDGPAFYDSLVRSGSRLAEQIVFITGDTLAPRTAQFLRQTGLPFLAKPFLVQELLLVVNRKLRAADVAERVGLETDVKTEKARTMSRKA